MLVSSHLMSELQDTADQLVVIGRGRLVAETSMAALLASASKDQVEVVTGARSEATTVLANAGATVTVRAADSVVVNGLGWRRIASLLGRGRSAVRRAPPPPRLTRRGLHGADPRIGRVPRPTETPDERRARGVDQAPHRPPVGHDSARSRRPDDRPQRTGRVRAAAPTSTRTGTSSSGPAAIRSPTSSGSSTSPSPETRRSRSTSTTLGAPAAPTRATGPAGPGTPVAATPWTDNAAGVTMKDGTESGTSYVSVLLTAKHGVRMQSDFTHDVAGSASTGSRWLRLTRTGDSVTGYESADGANVAKDRHHDPALAGHDRDRVHRSPRPRDSSSHGAWAARRSAVIEAIANATFDDVALDPATERDLAGNPGEDAAGEPRRTAPRALNQTGRS